MTAITSAKVLRARGRQEKPSSDFRCEPSLLGAGTCLSRLWQRHDQCDAVGNDELSVNGNGPSFAPGDLLRVDLTGVTNPIVPNNSSSGAVTSSNRQQVVFAQIERIPPHVTLHPASLTVTSGSTATFTAAASGLGTPGVQWEMSTNGGSSYSNVPGATSTTLSFTAESSQNGHIFRARFANSSGNATTTEAALTVDTATTTVVQSTPNPSFSGRQVGITATVAPSAATGTVTFTDNAAPLATVPLSNGSAALVTTLSAGTPNIVATYSGDATHAGSSGNLIHLHVADGRLQVGDSDRWRKVRHPAPRRDRRYRHVAHERSDDRIGSVRRLAGQHL